MTGNVDTNNAKSVVSQAKSASDYGGFLSKHPHYEVLNDYEPAPAFLKAMTNEMIYIDPDEEDPMPNSISNSQKLDSSFG